MENARKVSKRNMNMRKVLSVYGESDELSVICSTQNGLGIHRKYLNVLREYAERI
jgi:hypothetical protein